MAVPANICVAWPSTVASIPSGWTRETTLDARYILGAATGDDTDLSTDRGATTHTHTSPSHAPTQNSHTHDFANPGGDADSTIITGTTASSGSDAGHGHDAKTSNGKVATNDGIAITVDATSNDVAFLEVIWIKSDGTPVTLPTSCIAFFESDSLPSGWARVNGDRYLKGAATAGNGGATGGSNTHTHTSPAHTHTSPGHIHTGTSNGGNTAAFGKGTGTDPLASTGHTHAVVLQATAIVNQSVTTVIDAANHEPPFKKLNTVQTSGASLPTNIVTLWLGTNALVPSGWSRYTAMDGKWLKGANANGESGITTGGGTQHSHTAASCQPIQNAHTHSVVDSNSIGGATAASGSSNTFANDPHRHATWTCTTDTATNNAEPVTIDLCTVNAALPKHRTVIYVQFTGSAPTRPPVTITSYDLNLFDIGDPYTGLLPEAEHRIAAGDLRHLPH